MTEQREPFDSQLEATTRSRSWLWPTLALVAVLVIAVVVGRLGETPGETNPVAATPAVQAQVGPLRSLTPVSLPISSSSVGLVGTPIGIRSGGKRYDDGIPATLDGNPVLRVRDAAALPGGSDVLVGGWANQLLCASVSDPGSCPLELSDVPGGSSRAAAVSLVGQAASDYGRGPRIFEASVLGDLGCTSSSADTCLPNVNIGQPLWTGDDETAATPIDTQSLLSSLAARFPTLDLLPFEESSSCPVQWPAQSYLASSPTVSRAERSDLPIRLIVIYPGPADLATDSPATRIAAAAMSSFDASNRCVAIPGGVNDSAWIVRDNVMVLLGAGDDADRAQVSSALDELSPAD